MSESTSNTEWYGQQEKDRWETPPETVDILQSHLTIDCDPCAGPSTGIGEVNWSIHRGEDGLSRDWGQHDVLYINPPFSEKTEWIEKTISEIENTDLLILLTPASVDVQSWWHGQIVPHADHIWFSEGRISFIDPDTGSEAGSPTFGTALSFFGDVPESLLEELSEEGWLPTY